MENKEKAVEIVAARFPAHEKAALVDAAWRERVRTSELVRQLVREGLERRGIEIEIPQGSKRAS